jgi:hypothetical protein
MMLGEKRQGSLATDGRATIVCKVLSREEDSQ